MRNHIDFIAEDENSADDDSYGGDDLTTQQDQAIFMSMGTSMNMDEA